MDCNQFGKKVKNNVIDNFFKYGVKLHMRIKFVLALALLIVGLIPLATHASLYAENRKLELADAQELKLVELTITYTDDPYNLNLSFKSLAKEDLAIIVPWGYIAATRGSSASRFLFLSRLDYPVGEGVTIDYLMPVLLMDRDLGAPPDGTEYEKLLVDDAILRILGAAKKKFASDNAGRTIDPVWYMKCLRVMLCYDPEIKINQDVTKLIREMETDANKQAYLAGIALEWQLFRMREIFKGID